MTTHKQYLAQVKLAFDPDQWWNAMKLTNGGIKRYADTLEEAENAICFASSRYPDDPDEQVIESRIRVREVTEWEDVTETAHE